MESFNKKDHWENIYNTKTLNEVSWYQKIPQTSLDFIKEANISKDDAIIDIGGGDSFLVDSLLDLGYTDVSILDISAKSIQRAQERLGERESEVTWIAQDLLDFEPNNKFRFWHDRAVFHFLTKDSEVEIYRKKVAKAIDKGGNLCMATFSKNGPLKCSGIDIRQYSTDDLIELFKEDFRPVKTKVELHETPFGTTQEFSIVLFERK